jgi:hypothetical protein
MQGGECKRLSPSAKELVGEKATHQVPTFFLERELPPFWLSPLHFLVLIDSSGYTSLEERSSESVNSRNSPYAHERGKNDIFI